MPFVIFKNISLVYGLSENLTDAIDCFSRKKKKKAYIHAYTTISKSIEVILKIHALNLSKGDSVAYWAMYFEIRRISHIVVG